MKLCRIIEQGVIKYAVYRDGKYIGLLIRNGGFIETDECKEFKLLSPCVPGKIVAVGMNYDAHIKELHADLKERPSSPVIFLKPSTCVIGPDEEIVITKHSNRVDYEGELGIVIGRVCKDVPRDEALDYILGYTCLNDVTARDLQKPGEQWSVCKGFDTFCPIGPWIETDLDVSDIGVQSRLNGELRQDGRTSDMIFNVPELIEYISGIMTLLPFDIIATGTPSGIGKMEKGDTIEITVEGIGTLRNTVV